MARQYYFPHFYFSQANEVGGVCTRADTWVKGCVSEVSASNRWGTTVASEKKSLLSLFLCKISVSLCLPLNPGFL